MYTARSFRKCDGSAAPEEGVRVRAHVCECVHVHKCLRMCTKVYVCVSTSVRTSMCMCKCVHLCVLRMAFISSAWQS